MLDLSNHFSNVGLLCMVFDLILLIYTEYFKKLGSNPSDELTEEIPLSGFAFLKCNVIPYAILSM